MEFSVNSGECVVSPSQDICLQAVVGTCVSVCIRDTQQGFGGMCHYRLSTANQSITDDSQEYDYGDRAILALLQKLKHQGASRQHLEAWVIGGGNLNTSSIDICRQIGVRNIAIAFRVLAEYGIPISGTSIGGDTGRQIRFFPGTGEVLCRQTHKSKSAGDAEHHQAIFLSNNEPLFDKLQQTLTGAGINTRMALSSTAESLQDQVLVIDESWLMSAGHQVEGPQYTAPVVLLQNHDTCPSSFTLDRVINQFGSLVFIANRQNLPKVLKAAVHTRTLSCALGAEEQALSHSHCQESLVMIGSSTGGIDALDSVIKHLPAIMPPVCIVQHLPEGYTDSLVAALDKIGNLKVCRAEDGMLAKPSTVYLAPGDRHLTVTPHGQQIMLRLRDSPPVNGFRPSVDTMFKSALKLEGKRLVAALLTGMGQDGAQGLLELKQVGAITLIQNEQSSVVYGMARAANELGAATRVVSLENMGQAIVDSIINTQQNHKHNQMQLL
ncbi:hypothetical protein L2750_22770 [Shewanella submarina]|uniref:Probable chemoreceptor glutamine deamidase CheD n=1 Tax=Shewanella submarina TaxID=2016376 RepID=A0ABV7GDC3_9GAMM|nr:chemotaxis protein CheB [Shewanella submarina]MCL1039927.1 hypothetical protein [Shewanella submarina]